MERFELRVEGWEEAFVFGDLQGEWFRQREQQVQRTWSGAEPHRPEQQRAACVVEFMMQGKGEESGKQDRAGAGTGALCICPCQGTFTGVEERPWLVELLHLLEAPESRHPQLSFVPHCFPNTRNSLCHNGL